MRDEEMRERAFENIVRNAREAAGREGHVAIAVARDDPARAHSTAQDGPARPARAPRPAPAATSRVGDARGPPAGADRDVRPFRSTKPGAPGLGLPLALKIVH